MAVVIASDLGKDIAGEPLLRGISFKLERRDRMTLSGRNGAGKTTLLRMLAGEASVDSGELVLAKGAKIALHDQRPPRDRDLSLRDYILSGAPRAGGDRAASWPRSSRRWRRAPTTRRRSTATPKPRRGWSTPGATTGATARWPRCTGSASATTPTWTARWTRSPAVSSPAPRSAVRWPGTPDLLLLDEPTNHLDIESLEWLEAHLIWPRRRDRARRPRPLVPGVGRHLGARAGGRAREVLLRHLARVAQGEGLTRAGAGARDRAPGGRDRAPGAVRHPLSRGDPCPPGPVAGQEAVQDRAAVGRPGRRCRPQFAFKPPERSGRVVFELEHAELSAGGKELLHDAELWLERGEHVSLVGANGTGKTTLIETLAGRRELPGGQAPAPATTSSSATSPSTPRSSTRAPRAPCWRPRSAPAG